jgi:cyclin-dependent kinase 12/13
MVFEYVDYDLTGLLDWEYKFEARQVKAIAFQLLTVLDFLHGRGFVHRDLKCSNILLMDDHTVKLADFGLSRSLTPDGVDRADLTNRVITLWYRPPELLLGATRYDATVDIWSVGCIIVELFTGKPAFPARVEAEQLHNLVGILGTPPQQSSLRQCPGWAGFAAAEPEEKKGRLAEWVQRHPAIAADADLVSLLLRLLEADPRSRISAREALGSRWFRDVDPRRPLAGLRGQRVQQNPSFRHGVDHHEYLAKKKKKGAAEEAGAAAAAMAMASASASAMAMAGPAAGPAATTGSAAPGTSAAALAVAVAAATAAAAKAAAAVAAATAADAPAHPRGIGGLAPAPSSYAAPPRGPPLFAQGGGTQLQHQPPYPFPPQSQGPHHHSQHMSGGPGGEILPSFHALYGGQGGGAGAGVGFYPGGQGQGQGQPQPQQLQTAADGFLETCCTSATKLLEHMGGYWTDLIRASHSLVAPGPAAEEALARLDGAQGHLASFVRDIGAFAASANATHHQQAEVVRAVSALLHRPREDIALATRRLQAILAPASGAAGGGGGGMAAATGGAAGWTVGGGGGGDVGGGAAMGGIGAGWRKRSRSQER